MSMSRTMHALVYEGAGRTVWREVPMPRLRSDTDAIVRVDAGTICGTDLHILKGDVPGVTPGRVLGHEAVGTVEEVGSGVRTTSVGDRVLISCITACGCCRSCRERRYGQCVGGGGWILGRVEDGTQAEYVRVPFVDTSAYPMPVGLSEEDVLMLADIAPTGFEVGVLNGRVGPGDTVVVIGAGPVGLSAVMGSRLFSPSHVVAVDVADGRLDVARLLGADTTINSRHEDAASRILDATGGLGADVAIEAVGAPETFALCAEIITPGGRLANIGVHGRAATLHLERLWSKDVTITTGLVDTSSTPTLLRLATHKQIDLAPFVTHAFSMSEVVEAYTVFADPVRSNALKVVLAL